MCDEHAHALPALSQQAAARPVSAWHPSQLEPLLGLQMGSASPSQLSTSATRNQAQMLSTLQALIARGRSMHSARQGSLIASSGACANLAAAGISVPDPLGANGMAWPPAPAQPPISQLQSAGPWGGNNALLNAGFLGQTPVSLQPSRGFGEAGNGPWGNAVNTKMVPGWHAYSASVGNLPAASLAGQVVANVGLPPSNSSCLPYQANAHIACMPEGGMLAGGDGDMPFKRKFGRGNPAGAFAPVWAPGQHNSFGQLSKRVKEDTSMMSASSGAAGGNACRMARARQKQGGKWQKEAAQFKAENGGAGNPVRKEPNQVIAFRNFLLGEERKQLLRLTPASTANDPQNPLGFSVIQILDVDAWWERVRAWFEDDPDRFSLRAFFMMLRRMGLKPINKAAPPATSGLDYRLRNREVAVQGYVHDPAVFSKYCTRQHLYNKASPEPASATLPRDICHASFESLGTSPDNEGGPLETPPVYEEPSAPPLR